MTHKQTLLRRTFTAALILAAAGLTHAAEGPYAADEKDLIDKLRTAQPSEKAIACKQLAIYGTAAAVPELAKLLADPQLSSWSRIALEAIPDKSADEALVAATATVTGRQLIGVVNSIGVRRSGAAVQPLAGLLQTQQVDVAAAAAIALGRIADGESIRILRESLKSSKDKSVKVAVAEGCILCAERLTAGGKSDAASAIFDEVRKADVGPQKVREATRGAILARGVDGVPLLIEQLESTNKATFRMGLKVARELQGGEVVDAIANQLKGADPERAALLLSAIADRSDAKLSPAILEAAKSGDKAVRLAAIGVVGRLGDAGSAPALLHIATDDDADVGSAAKVALAALKGELVNSELAGRLANAEGKELAVLLEIVGQRRISAAAELKKALKSSDEAIRAAALAALGETASMDDLSVLIAEAASAKSRSNQEGAIRALQAAAVRMPDRDACAAQITAAIDDARPAVKPKLLETLGSVGGAKSLETIAAAIKGSNEELQDAGSRVLGEWMTADAAPVLLELSKDPACARYQVRLLRGYLRIARQFVLPVDERAEMCRLALEAARRPAEQQLVLEVCERYPAVETLKVAAAASRIAGLTEAAHRTALAIMAQLASEGADVRDLLAKADIAPVTVEIVKADYGGRDIYRDVTDILAKHAGPLPVIALGAGYNESFGGDPVPNTPKRLRIQYRINGKAGEAEFPENSPIVLPLPE